MKKRPAKRSIPMLVLAAILGIAGSVAGVTAAEPVVILKMAVGDVEGGFVDAMAGKLAQEIVAASQERIGVEMIRYPGSDANRKMYEDMLGGGADLVLLDNWALGQYFPALAMLGEPYLFANPSQANSFYYGEGGARIQELVSSAGFRISGWLAFSPPMILSNRPLEGPEDFKTLRIATVPDRALILAFAKLSALYVNLPEDQWLSSLEAGAVDAVQIVPAALSGESLPKTATHITDAGLLYPYLAICCANSAWSKLSRELQDAFLEGIQKGGMAASNYNAQVSQALLQEFQDKGITLTDMDRGAVMHALWPDSDKPIVTGDQKLMQVMEKVAAPVYIY